MNNEFLVVSKEDMINRDIKQLDFIIVCGDAYIDHPSFCGAIIGRKLESIGFSVGIIPQPNWKDVNAFKVLGRPKYAFLVTSGNIDSMVNHYTASKKRRSEDEYSEGGLSGKRPDRAVIVYSNMIRQSYKKINIVIGGIEASLRRFSHYDYWDNKVRRSILTDSTANLLAYGMGENIIEKIAKKLEAGVKIEDITDIAGTCYNTNEIDFNKENLVILPSHKDVSSDKIKYNKAFKHQYLQQDPIRGKALAQYVDKNYVIQNPPAMPLTRQELDRVYDLPFTRKPHPMYKKKIPAIEEVEFSVSSNRGCFGSCSFCALTFHQGRIVTSRSKESIIREVKLLTKDENFKGYIHDIGGPTANFRKRACEKQLKEGSCKDRQCLFPTPCKNLEIDHREFIDVLSCASKVEGVKKVFVRSGIRYDYLYYEKDKSVLKSLIKNHISGQLKIAPEHISDKTLKQMGKPKKDIYNNFCREYKQINDSLGLKQYIVPYFMSSHPGCDTASAIELCEYLKKNDLRPRQVQDFYPTPGTLSTAMFYTGINPITGDKVFVANTYEAKQVQRALMQYYLPANKEKVKNALLKAGRKDLIGVGKEAIIYEVPTRQGRGSSKKVGGKGRSSNNRNSKNNNNKDRSGGRRKGR